MSPFKALYGQNPPPLSRGTIVPSRVEEINYLTFQQDSSLKELWENLQNAQIKSKGMLIFIVGMFN